MIKGIATHLEEGFGMAQRLTASSFLCDLLRAREEDEKKKDDEDDEDFDEDEDEEEEDE